MIRTISGTLAELRREDPETPVSEYALRSWIKSGAVPAVKSGNRFLIDMETLRRFLAGEV